MLIGERVARCACRPAALCEKCHEVSWRGGMAALGQGRRMNGKENICGVCVN